MPLYLSEMDVKRLLTMEIALDAIENAFHLIASGGAINNPRSRISLDQGTFHLMAAAAPTLGVMGTKTYSSIDSNPPQFYVHLYDIVNGQLLALISASDMGQIRTGAATGVATKYMARPTATIVGILGTGYQARTQLEAVCQVRDISLVKAFSRTVEGRENFAEWSSSTLGVKTVAVSSTQECVENSDIVITITSASSPVLKGKWLPPGSHVNAAGSNHRRRREVDSYALNLADVIIVDDIEQAKIECGDLIHPIEKGLFSWERVRSLDEVVSGITPSRNNDDEITIFESQGMAIEDIAVGSLLYDLASKQGVGKHLPI